MSTPAPDGYFLADNGDAIKKSCETCGYYYHYQEYSNHEIGCEFSDGENGMQYLPSFPFKNGCKHFAPHYIYLVDWDKEMQKMEEEAQICHHRTNGQCFSWLPCKNRGQTADDHPSCNKKKGERHDKGYL